MKYIPKAVSTRVARQALLASKHSPTLLFAGGVVGVVTTTVLACRSTLKLEEILESAQGDLRDAQKLIDTGHNDYSEEDHKKDTAYIYVRTAVGIVKLYAPAIVVGSLSIAALTGSHRILSRRNAALTAAYSAMDKAFRQYRQRVVDEYGEDRDREFLHGARTTSVKVDGKKVEQVKLNGPSTSMYAKLFGSHNKNWVPTPEYNMLFLRGQQLWANDRLHAQGHIFLNEVYDALGLERTSAGSVVGWVLGNGDDSVDFGIWTDKHANQIAEMYIDPENAGIWLDFNVDGVIYDLIDKG